MLRHIDGLAALGLGRRISPRDDMQSYLLTIEISRRTRISSFPSWQKLHMQNLEIKPPAPEVLQWRRWRRLPR